MKCHRHSDRDAIAICKHCMRGLCPACVTDTPGGAACSDPCAASIAFAEQVLTRSNRNIGLQRTAPGFAAAFLMVTGLGLVIHGALSGTALTAWMDVVFAVGAVGAYWLWRRFPDVGS